MEEIQKEKKKKKIKISKDVVNIIRTTMRNNIELTHIADNKANVLLSLNALMLTFFIPLAVPYREVIEQHRLFIPIGIFVITCLLTIYISSLVLKPGKFFRNQGNLKDGIPISPFFFGNFYKMSQEEYKEYLAGRIDDAGQIKVHLTEDLHYLGTRLGRKMELVRIAFNIFKIGITAAALLAAVLWYTVPH